MWLTWVLLGLSTAALVAATALLVRGAWLRPTTRPRLTLQVTRRHDYPGDWFTLVLQRPWYARFWPLPRFLAGQSVALSLPGSVLRRRYSLARWHALPRRYEITVKRETQGKFSPRLAAHARLGAQIALDAPGGDFVLPQGPTSRRLVLIAGGVGITPLLAMMDRLQGEPSSWQERHLYWQVRFEHEWIYRDALQQLASRDARVRLRLLVSRPDGGAAERISLALLQQELGSLVDTTFLMCANPSMLDDLNSGLQAHGVAPSAIHFERFTLGAAVQDAGAWQLDIAGKNLAFSGHASLLDALEDGGVFLPSDCRTGTCGQCRLNVLSGQVRHLVQAEFAVSASQVLACCCVPQSDLTLSFS
jgi:ferredoxin-NADP reductase